MKYQLNVFLKIFMQKLKWWYLVLLITSIVYYYYLKLTYTMIPISHNDVYSVLGVCLNFNQFLDINKVLFLFQIFLTYYSTICYFNYEKRNSPEIILLRINKKKLLLQKLIIFCCAICFIRLIYTLINYFLYIDLNIINLYVFINSIAVHIIIIIIYFFYKLILINNHV